MNVGCTKYCSEKCYLLKKSPDQIKPHVIKCYANIYFMRVINCTSCNGKCHENWIPSASPNTPKSCATKRGVKKEYWCPVDVGAVLYCAPTLGLLRPRVSGEKVRRRNTCQTLEREQRWAVSHLFTFDCCLDTRIGGWLMNYFASSEVIHNPSLSNKKWRWRWWLKFSRNCL